MLTASASALSFLIAFLTVRLLLSRFAGFALDRPNERSLHVRPVPRTGGLAILAGTAAAFPLIGGNSWPPVLLAMILAAMSFYDDVRGLRNRARLTVHVVAAAALVWWLGPLPPLAGVLLVVAVVWVTNLYNFMDGADGVAGGMAVIGFGTYALAAALAQHAELAALCGAIAAASAAFLVHNFHPARIFLGDVGSIPLGFLAAALGLAGWHDGLWPLWFPVLVFGPFNADATVTLVRRLARGDKVWRPHREHYYQRIVRMGLGHRAAALIGYAVMLCCAAAALLGRSQPPALQAAAFACGALVLAVMAVWVDVRWMHFAKDS
jgi:UDP-N-acetylmuramyl pentapeptide phosphotransferase/UDP-N-acetylglucosamine-1-phosphate transferase